MAENVPSMHESLDLWKHPSESYNNSLSTCGLDRVLSEDNLLGTYILSVTC